jgi:betaine-aldehyde dehydrogenase
MQNYKMWIGGEWVNAESGKTFATFNPTTGEEIAQIPLAGTADIDTAVEAARKAYPTWSRKTQAERSAVLNKIAAAIRENAEEFVRLETLEHGTPVKDAKNNVEFSAAGFEFAASAARTLMGHVIPAKTDVVTYVQREPIGVCATITPWNHALMMMAVKMGQAVAPGNTCILKPPSVNSLIGVKFAEMLDKLELPPGVINVITGPGNTAGEALVSHPGVDIVGFTGSSETGKAIMAAGSQTIKRFIMELGGNNPVIVLEDADVDAAASHLGHWQFHNTGQRCSCPGRCYIHEKIYDEFLEKFISTAKKIVVGDPADKNTFMGPLTSATHRDRVEAYIKSGIDEGAKLLLGGEKPTTPPLNKGFFVMPTVFTNVAENMKIAKEEVFGPVAIFMDAFSSEEEVIKLANNTRYGLTASVYTKDVAKAMEFANELHAGSVTVNSQMPPILTTELPWGGFGESGIGKEGGMDGLEPYTQLKLVCVKFA